MEVCCHNWGMTLDDGVHQRVLMRVHLRMHFTMHVSILSGSCFL